VQSDAEHQQDHADFGHLAGQSRVADEAGGERPHRDAGDQITDDGRDAQRTRQQTEQQCKHETDRQQRDERSFV